MGVSIAINVLTISLLIIAGRLLWPRRAELWAGLLASVLRRGGQGQMPQDGEAQVVKDQALQILSPPILAAPPILTAPPTARVRAIQPVPRRQWTIPEDRVPDKK